MALRGASESPLGRLVNDGWIESHGEAPGVGKKQTSLQ